MPRAVLEEKDINPRYQRDDLKKRRDVLRDTLTKLDTEDKRNNYHLKAQKNLQSWQEIYYIPLTSRVRVLQGDWGEVALGLSKDEGKIYAVLNMANAYTPGGGYLEGSVAQEENMFRRTDCHYYVTDDEMNAEKTRYTPEMTALINGENGVVYLDKENPRVCIKGKEAPNADGYEDLGENNYFLFYELKSAADDLRGGHPFNEASMRKKIRAQLDTLHSQNIRHVVLSAFGCGAFQNPPEKVARIYREELEKSVDYFESVVFAIFAPGYGPDNYTPFHNELNGLSLTKEQKEADLRQLTSFLETLAENLQSKEWDNRGYVIPFFDFRKTPKGIEEMRAVFAKANGPLLKLYELKRIAEYRLAHPPLFTIRDDQVRELYVHILELKFDNLNNTITNSFKL